jgi:hypothetical protein
MKHLYLLLIPLACHFKVGAQEKKTTNSALIIKTNLFSMLSGPPSIHAEFKVAKKTSIQANYRYANYEFFWEKYRFINANIDVRFYNNAVKATDLKGLYGSLGVGILHDYYSQQKYTGTKYYYTEATWLELAIVKLGYQFGNKKRRWYGDLNVGASTIKFPLYKEEGNGRDHSFRATAAVGYRIF